MSRSRSALVERAAAYFVAPPPRTARPPALDHLPVQRRTVAGHPSAAAPPPVRAAVLGGPAAAPAVAAALATALRGVDRCPAAAVAVWAPPRAADLAPPLPAPVGEAAPAAPAWPSMPATLAAARLAARLTTRGLPAAARGRLAWLSLAEHPVAAALTARRASGALQVPLVLALAGPRSEVLEGLLEEQDLVVVVATDPDGALARIAVASSPVPAVACRPCATGPARMAALAGLTGRRGLAEPVRDAIDALRRPPPRDLTSTGGAAW